jgi:Uncharacterized protein conserved in bacteria
MSHQGTAAGEIRIQGLDELLKAAEADRLPPVDKWDPPYCGDIGMRIRADGDLALSEQPDHPKTA